MVGAMMMPRLMLMLGLTEMPGPESENWGHERGVRAGTRWAALDGDGERNQLRMV